MSEIDLAAFFRANGSNLIQSIGSTFEVIGAILMANKYFNVKSKWRVPQILLSATVRGKNAKAANAIADMSEDRGMTSLQGMSLIAVGFIIQLLYQIFQVGSYIHQNGIK